MVDSRTAPGGGMACKWVCAALLPAGPRRRGDVADEPIELAPGQEITVARWCQRPWTPVVVVARGGAGGTGRVGDSLVVRDGWSGLLGEGWACGEAA
jgi:hypothetical protein